MVATKRSHILKHMINIVIINGVISAAEITWFLLGFYLIQFPKTY